MTRYNKSGKLEGTALVAPILPLNKLCADSNPVIKTSRDSIKGMPIMKLNKGIFSSEIGIKKPYIAKESLSYISSSRNNLQSQRNSYHPVIRHISESKTRHKKCVESATTSLV